MRPGLELGLGRTGVLQKDISLPGTEFPVGEVEDVVLFAEERGEMRHWDGSLERSCAG